MKILKIIISFFCSLLLVGCLTFLGLCINSKVFFSNANMKKISLSTSFTDENIDCIIKSISNNELFKNASKDDFEKLLNNDDFQSLFFVSYKEQLLNKKNIKNSINYPSKEEITNFVYNNYNDIKKVFNLKDDNITMDNATKLINNNYDNIINGFNKLNIVVGEK